MFGEEGGVVKKYFTPILLGLRTFNADDIAMIMEPGSLGVGNEIYS